MSTTFEQAVEGDSVWCMRRGQGYIISINPSATHPIAVVFPEVVVDRSSFDTPLVTIPRRCEYTYDGKESPLDVSRILFWEEVSVTPPNQPPSQRNVVGTFDPVDGDAFCIPGTFDVDYVWIFDCFDSNNESHVEFASLGLCYPWTKEGRIAASLRGKALFK